MKGMVFNIQKFCVNDGPGIRTTVFLKGCPLSCVWCHNPESQSFDKEIIFYKNKCTGCGSCEGLTTEKTGFICYNGAKEICGRTVDSDEVIADVIKDKAFYDNSGGGITLSGGEPLSQFDFALEILKKSKDLGLHTAIETCGFALQKQIEKISKYIDLFLFDYKETDPIVHKEYTGVSNEVIMDNLRCIDRLEKQIILRCPIIPGYNDRANHFSGISDTANSCKNIKQIEIEPYHLFAKEKYIALNRTAANISVPSDTDVKAWISEISRLTDIKVVEA